VNTLFFLAAIESPFHTEQKTPTLGIAKNPPFDGFLWLTSPLTSKPMIAQRVRRPPEYTDS